MLVGIPAKDQSISGPRVALAAMACLLALGTHLPAHADLPSDGWPQTRRDAAQMGRSPEPALADPVVVWSRAVGDSLGGEIVANGCALFVGNGGGEVLRVNARSGQREWRSASAPACGPVAQAESALALDTQGQLLAGLPGDPRLRQLQQAMFALVVAIHSYSIDNNEWPPGIDLRAELAPTYIDPWPLNPCTGADIGVSETESHGDVRYARPSSDPFYLGGWWVDGGLVPSPLDGWPGVGGLHPSWPPSTDPGGGGSSLEPTDGSPRWRKTSRGVATSTSPRLLPQGIAWTEGGLPAWSIATGAGRLHVTDPAGVTRWESFRMEGYLGGACIDEAADALFASAARAPYGWFFDQQAGTLATAVESYWIDNGVFPPTGDLEPSLVPTYLRVMVPNPLTGDVATWSLTPSPGNYSYEALNGGMEYRLGIWSVEGVLVSIFETSVLVLPAPDDPGLVESRALTDGTLRWRVPIEGIENPTPPMMTSEGVVVGDTAGIVRCLDRTDGHELWRVDAGTGLWLAPALLPDGGLVFVQSGGEVLVVDAPPLQRVRWRLPLGGTCWAAPTVTSDGVILVGDGSGILHAIRPDGSVLWIRDCGGPAAAALTTSVLPHEGWLYVGRSDGALVALAPSDTGGMPPPLTGLLMAQRTPLPIVTGLRWDGSPLPTSILGAHYHLKRSFGSPLGPWTNVLSPHSFTGTLVGDASAGQALVFYTLTVADCGENEP